jgi:hypothetical protein
MNKDDGRLLVLCIGIIVGFGAGLIAALYYRLT